MSQTFFQTLVHFISEAVICKISKFNF